MMILPIAILMLSAATEPFEELVLPRVIQDVCPFECCGYGTWVAMQETRTYKKKGDANEVAFIVREGESIATLGGDYIVQKAGKAKLLKDHCENDFFDWGHKFPKGDEVALLAYLGEGAWQVWHRGEFLEIESFWASPELQLDCPAVEQSWPEMEWWIHAKNGQGAEGWIMIRVFQSEDPMLVIEFDQGFDGMDGCN